jgi:hypothetical protein
MRNLVLSSVLFSFFFLGGILRSQQGQNSKAPTSSVFGNSQQSEAAMMGILYDLKQTQDRKSTNVDPNTYTDVLDEYFLKNWDESVLEHYYRVSKPLFTTQVFVPNMDADNAPKAFGAEKTVQPSRWVIHYKAQVSAPVDGTYRFWGCADDVMAVAVNDKTELICERPDMRFTKTQWKASEPDGAQGADDSLRPGDWFTVKADDIIDLDIVIGERPGGYFNAFVMIEKQGEGYEKDAKGHNILPIFQVAPYDTPALNDVNKEPKFCKATPGSIWKSHQ